MTQAKLTSLYGNITKANNGSYKSGFGSRSRSSEDCMIVEKACSNSNLSKGHGPSDFLNLEGEERGHRNNLGMKRAHVEISSPRNSSVKSPSSVEIVSNDASTNGFVTARTKLVFYFYFEHFLFVTCCDYTSHEGFLFLLFFYRLKYCQSICRV